MKKWSYSHNISHGLSSSYYTLYVNKKLKWKLFEWKLMNELIKNNINRQKELN